MRSDNEKYSENQRKINQDIKNGVFAPVYLIYGSQAYLRSQNRDKLAKAVSGDEDLSASMNVSRFTGKDADILQILEAIRTLPFFAERRAVLLDGIGVFEKAEIADPLSDALSGDWPETTHLIICEEKADLRKKLFKTVAKAGTVLPCDEVPEDQIVRWAGSLFRNAGLSIGERELALFIGRTGTDMLRIRSEADKLIGYCTGTVTEADIVQLCHPRPEDKVFEMIEMTAAGRPGAVMTRYADLLSLNTPPQVILSLLERQFRQLMAIREMNPEMADSELASYLGINPYIFRKKLKSLAAKRPAEEWRRALDLCLEADSDYKSGRIDDRTAVETVLIRAAMPAELRKQAVQKELE